MLMLLGFNRVLLAIVVFLDCLDQKVLVEILVVLASLVFLEQEYVAQSKSV